MDKMDVAMVGLGVMGANLARNIERRGYSCMLYNRTPEAVEKFMSAFGTGRFRMARTPQELAAGLVQPRRVFMMVKAGGATDSTIDSLLPFLEAGDILIDGGNADFRDTQRREKQCAEHGVQFLGIGVSGGEEGALYGPSIMPGGRREAWEKVAPLLAEIAARANGEPCTAYMGPDGAGHFVKMVHNGIEYGDMQLIAEAYDLLRRLIGAGPAELSAIFEGWNRGPLASFLVAITAEVFKRRDPLGDGYLVDVILDSAGQKGTGRWTVQNALELGVPVPTISAAVDARVLSGLKAERVQAARELVLGETIGPEPGLHNEREPLIAAIHDALFCAKILAYAQGLKLLQAASEKWLWGLDLGEIAAIWRAGCIIRAAFLDEIRSAYRRDRNLANLMFDPPLRAELVQRIGRLRSVAALAAMRGIPVPAFASALAYYDSYRSPELPQNLIQAQRDFFGAHTYERKDRPGIFHTDWQAEKG